MSTPADTLPCIDPGWEPREGQLWCTGCGRSAHDIFGNGHGRISVAAVDTVVEAVREDLLKRSQVGIKKYGVTLDRTDLTLKDWLQHAYEECLDQANYLKRAILELEGKP